MISACASTAILHSRSGQIARTCATWLCFDSHTIQEDEDLGADAGSLDAGARLRAAPSLKKDVQAPETP
eukprot:4630946-Amphidinium_carterae.1